MPAVLGAAGDSVCLFSRVQRKAGPDPRGFNWHIGKAEMVMLAVVKARGAIEVFLHQSHRPFRKLSVRDIMERHLMRIKTLAERCNGTVQIRNPNGHLQQ